MQEEISAQSTAQLLLTSCWHHIHRVLLHLCPTWIRQSHFPTHWSFIFVSGSELHISYFHLWSHRASKSTWEVSPFWGARGLTSVVLFFFKQFLIRPWKKDVGGEVGAEPGKGDFSSDCFNRLLAGVGGSDMARGQLLQEVCPAMGRLQY